MAALFVATLFVGTPLASGFQTDDPDRDRAVEQAQSAMQSGNLSEARRVAKAWLDARPGDPVMLQFVGRIDSLHGDKKRGLAAMIAYGSSVDAFEKAQQAVDSGKLLERSYHTWAYCLYKLGKYAEAIEQLQFSFDGSARDALKYALRARCRRELNEPDRAVADYTAALGITPHDPGLLLERAGIRRSQGEGAAAATELSIAVDELPLPSGEQHTRLLRWIFEYYLGQNDIDRAIAPLERIRDRQPNLGWLRLELGMLYYRKGEFDRAVAEFQPLLNRTLAVQSYGLGRAYVRLGLIAQHNDDHALAEKHFRRALDLSPNEATALRGLVGCLRRAGKKDEAREFVVRLRQAVHLEEVIRRVNRQISRNSKNREARTKKIRALLDLERWDEASNEIEIYSRVFKDGTEARHEQELQRRRKAAGTP